MGFTVIGARTFLGSGHPTEGTDGDANRGLIESTDSGKTWKTLSLRGTTDFHALKYAHDTVYGHDSTSGVLRVSTNHTTWDTRAQLAALDIAVSPKDPDLLLATTEAGVAKSTDGGQKFGDGSGQVLAFPVLAQGRRAVRLRPRRRPAPQHRQRRHLEEDRHRPRRTAPGPDRRRR
ncbi:hypothetical protein [Streptomyces sp. NPDC055692]|uniref:hypothetical protein n=1 Tax=Streptomyces sp. NPDC055692 TaxID=3155683 RepID=UPI0034252CCC